jgi:N-acyl-D-amino-acid deacylase
MAFDVLITNGTLVDGTGNPGYAGHVGIRDGVIHILRGALDSTEAAHTIDASDRVVAPGFIDMHSHSGLSLLHDGAHEPKIRQGVTTEVIGVDGNSYAPFLTEDQLRDFVDFNAGLDGRPPIDYSWTRVAEYLTRFDGRVTVNTAMMIGNAALRISVIGWNDTEASGAALADMRAMLREGMQEGAFGLSTGLDYPPGAYATTAELASLSEEAAALGGFYHTHVRYQLGDRFLDPFREAIEIGRRAEIPVHLTHLYRKRTAPGGAADLLEYVDASRATGQDITFDTYPYEWSSTRLTMLVPIWIQDGGPQALLARLSDDAGRPEIEAAIEKRGADYGGEHVWDRIRVGYFNAPTNLDLEGLTIAEVASRRGQTPAQAICDLLLEERLAVNEVAAGPDPASLPRFSTHPLAMIGSDSVFFGKKPSPRTYGTFARVLGEFARDERLLSLPDAVRRMSSFPAQRLGLRNRGLLRDGMAADVIVFDPKRVRAHATFEAPRQMASGIDDVVINGEIVLKDGVMTEARPGRALRRGAA